MPMLRSCSFPQCETLTLSPYCYEHDQLTAKLETERRADAAARDEPLVRELAEVARPVSAPAVP